ncbi:MAG: glycosyltransferase family 4 protein [Thermoplasmata archaeon]|nr:glycosyltransferase family 4 protein [Thermoplasmata archaeon]
MTKALFLVSNPVDPDPRVLREAEALADAGIGVTILALRRRGQRTESESLDGVEIRRVGVPIPYGSPPALLLGILSMLPSALGSSSFDIVHCHDLDTLLLGVLLKRRLGVPLIYDSHEYYPGMAFPRGGIPMRILEALEARLLTQVDAVITVGERLRRRFLEMGVRRVEVVGNWRDPVDPGDREELRRSWGVCSEIVISYVGNLNPGRRIRELMEAIAGLKGFYLVIGGFKGIEDEVREFASKHDNIIFLGKVPPERIPSVFHASDAVFYVPEPTPNGHYSAPNSFFTALSVGRPVITSDYGEIADLVRETGCGFIVEPTVNGIRSFLLRMGEGIREAWPRCRSSRVKYSWSEARRRLLELYGVLLP